MDVALIQKVVLRLSDSWLNWNLKMLVFEEERKNNNNNNYYNNNNNLEVVHPQSGSSSTLFLIELEFGNVGF